MGSQKKLTRLKAFCSTRVVLIGCLTNLHQSHCGVLLLLLLEAFRTRFDLACGLQVWLGTQQVPAIGLRSMCWSLHWVTPSTVLTWTLENPVVTWGIWGDLWIPMDSLFADPPHPYPWPNPHNRRSPLIFLGLPASVVLYGSKMFQASGAAAAGKRSRMSKWDDKSAASSTTDWGKKWRAVVKAVLPKDGNGGVTCSDPEVQKLCLAMWRDLSSWAAEECRQHLMLFQADEQGRVEHDKQDGHWGTHTHRQSQTITDIWKWTCPNNIHEKPQSGEFGTYRLSL